MIQGRRQGEGRGLSAFAFVCVSLYCEVIWCEKCSFDMICALIRWVFENFLDFHAAELYSAKRADVARIFVILMNLHMDMNWTCIKVALIWVNVILILVQFLVFANPLILILI